jgi:hypothetical protein
MPKENDSGKIKFSIPFKAFADVLVLFYVYDSSFLSRGYTCSYTVRVLNINTHVHFYHKMHFSDFSYIKDSESITVKNIITAKL